MDNHNKTNNGHRNQETAGESCEVGYFIKKLNVSRLRVMNAIRAVGNDRKKLEAYLRR